MRENAAFTYQGNGKGTLGRIDAKNCGMAIALRSGIRDWLEVGAGVALAVAAEPIHEVGHAVAARLLTGAWPQVGFWAVHPTAPFESAAAVLGVLAAGDAAVLMWWALMIRVAYRHPDRKWILIGPTFVTGLGLLNWLAAAVLSPFGYGDSGASDALKFMAVSGVGWLPLAMVIAMSCLAIGAVTWRCLANQRAADPTCSPRS